MSLVRPPDWTEEAACLDLATRDRDIWSPGEHLTPEQTAFELHLARRICASCPVRIDCVVQELGMLPQMAPVSMRGGLTPDELVALAKDMGLPHRQAAQHGNRSRYVGGCRCDDCRNAHRVYEHERRLWARSRKHQISAAEVHAWLTKPMGRGRHRAAPGQLLLFTTGLPTHRYREPA
jgi:hypothetical protein